MSSNTNNKVEPQKLGKCKICDKQHESDVQIGNSVGDGSELALNIAIANGVNDVNTYRKSHDFYNSRENKSVKNKIYSQIEAHHLICSEAMEDKQNSGGSTWMDLCISFGYDINCKENGVFLPFSLEMDCAKKVPLHRGNHNATIGSNDLNYVDSVVHLIKPIKKNAECFCKNPKKFKEVLDSKSKKIFGYVKAFT